MATLGYSRMSFVRFVRDETWPTVRTCLEAAFGYLGGVPRELLFDNMKTVVLERNAYGRGRHRLHPGLLALSRDLGFAVRLCRPYRAKTKGKVERYITRIERRGRPRTINYGHSVMVGILTQVLPYSMD